MNRFEIIDEMDGTIFGSDDLKECYEHIIENAMSDERIGKLQIVDNLLEGDNIEAWELVESFEQGLECEDLREIQYEGDYWYLRGKYIEN